jgi:hypothetical protein
VEVEALPAVSRLVTGERVVRSEGGFNGSHQRHVASYRLDLVAVCRGPLGADRRVPRR